MNSPLNYTHLSLASKIDHMMLDPKITEEETLSGCSLSRAYGVASVLVKPCFVRQAVAALRGSLVSVGTAIAFPYGVSSTVIKVSETKRVLTEGALELEVAINNGYLIGSQLDLFLIDIQSVCGVAHMNGAHVKAIIDTTLLTETQIIESANIAEKAGVDWVTLIFDSGYQNSNLKTIMKIREEISDNVMIKAVAGVTTRSDLIFYLEAGCDRVGTAGAGDILSN